MQLYVKTAYLSWYSIGESNTVNSVPKPLQEGGFSHAAHECNIKCNKTVDGFSYLIVHNIMLCRYGFCSSDLHD